MDIRRIVSPECHLQNELCCEILLRLPIKSLLRLCCVSKWWLSLIRAPDFRRLRLQNSKKNSDGTHLLVVQGRLRECVVRRSDTFETNSETLLTLGDPIGDERSWRISCSVDGLFLLRSWERHGINNSRITEHLRIWNPSIRKFHDIPSLLGFGTSQDSFYWEDGETGLGYDPLVDDYKYIKVVRESRNQPTLVAVYTLGAASWKIIPCQGKEGCNFVWDFSFTRDKVYLWGKLYFIATHHELKVCELVSFDVSSEEFSSVSLPVADSRITEHANGYFTLVRNGCSSLVLFFYSDSLTMWVLESDSARWTEPSKLDMIFRPDYFYLKKNRDMLLWWRRCEAPYRLSARKTLQRNLAASYNLETKEEKVLLVHEEHGDDFQVHQVYGYMESLVLA